MAEKKKIIIVGGGLSGLMATIKVCELGGEVDLFSYCPVKRSHSLCAQGGINACMDSKGEHDSVYEHFDDTVYGGDFLADQVAVKGMVEAAPKLIKMFDRMGVPFTRTPEGNLDLRNFGGQKNKRTCFAGSTTGQQLLYALDEQVRRWEVKGGVKKYEFWEFIRIIKNKDGICRGIVAQNMNSMEIKAFPADVVILATGGPGQVFGRCTASTICNGSAVSAVYQQGAHIGNPEFIQIHPTAIPGSDKNRLMSEACRGEGGRVWVYRDGKPWYFLEDMYPAYGNLVPRDVASRAIFKVCVHMGLGINGENRVYLDLSHIDPHYLERKLGGILEIYMDFVGKDPRKVPMEIFPSVHYSMGGIWVDRLHHTNIKGLMARASATTSTTARTASARTRSFPPLTPARSPVLKPCAWRRPVSLATPSRRRSLTRRVRKSSTSSKASSRWTAPRTRTSFITSLATSCTSMFPSSATTTASTSASWSSRKSSSAGTTSA